MAPYEEKRNRAEVPQQVSVRRDQGKQPQTSPLRSDCLKDRSPERGPSPASDSPRKQSPQTLLAPLQTKIGKRKRSQEPDNPLFHTPVERLQISVADLAVEATSGITDDIPDPIDYWRKYRHWPKEYFEQDDQAREVFKKDFEKDSWYEKYWIPEMDHLLVRKKSSSSLRGKQSEVSSVIPSSTTPSDQKPREAKSIAYMHPSYDTVLATKGSFMDNSNLGITDTSKKLCQNLLEAKQVVPQDTLFRDDLFDEACENVRARNEAMVIRDISPLICPSAQVLWIYGAKHLKSLTETVNEGWNRAIPFYGPRPQPDYSVGFGRSAFTDDQLEKLIPFVGEIMDTFTSYFMATWQMYFPFLTCEVKCSATVLDIADRQNSHSMTIATRGVVELFRLVGCEKELHREILAFSISHDDRMVRIYGHYPVINGKDTTYYRHPIREFSFISEDGKEKWTAYKFTKNVYDTWMPTHLQRICSVIDKLPPGINFNVSELQPSGTSGLSQVFEDQSLSQPSKPTGNDDNQSSLAGSIISNTSSSYGTEKGGFKMSKKRRTTE